VLISTQIVCGLRRMLSVNCHVSYISVLQVRLVCEYCDKGSLREALDLGAYKRPDGTVNYPAVLDTAIDIATAVAHLHHRNVLHSDLKVGWGCWGLGRWGSGDTTVVWTPGGPVLQVE
jgi:serine/threonine protein kinase